MIGYCAIGRNGIASTPINEMSSATTHANTGRSMKKLGITVLDAVGSARDDGRLAGLPDVRLSVGGAPHRLGLDAPRRRGDDVAGHELLEALDDDAIAGLHA